MYMYTVYQAALPLLTSHTCRERSTGPFPQHTPLPCLGQGSSTMYVLFQETVGLNSLESGCPGKAGQKEREKSWDIIFQEQVPPTGEGTGIQLLGPLTI